MNAQRRADKDLFDRVLAVLNHFDLAGVSPGEEDGAAQDEYANEAGPVSSVLRNRGRITWTELSDIWSKSFGDDLSGMSIIESDELLEAFNDLVPGPIEPPPVGHEAFHSQYTSPIPFGSPPYEPIALIGDVPWELQDGKD